MNNATSDNTNLDNASLLDNTSLDSIKVSLGGIKNNAKNAAKTFDCILIIGMGLIGGSLAKALCTLDKKPHIIGADVDQKTLNIALEQHIIDEAICICDEIANAKTDEEASSSSGNLPANNFSANNLPANDLSVNLMGVLQKNSIDLIVLALPSEHCADIFAAIEKSGYKGAITDTASTKTDICKIANSTLSDTTRYIPSHPMAGREVGGISAASPDLFLGSYWIVCPDERTNMQMFLNLHTMLTAIGAKCISIPREAHDSIIAVVSHVPHMTASALVALAGKHCESNHELLRLAAGGFKDSTRIAAGSPELWAGIALSNADEINKGLFELINILQNIRRLIDTKNKPGLVDFLKETSNIRKQIPTYWLPNSSNLILVELQLNNQVGAIAKVTSIAGKFGCNILSININHLSDKSAILELVFADEGNIEAMISDLEKNGFDLTYASNAASVENALNAANALNLSKNVEGKSVGDVNSAAPFCGTTTVPSDKSISHRALMMASMATGVSELCNLLDSQDVRSTLEIMRALGAQIEVQNEDGVSFDATVEGWGTNGPCCPNRPLDCGNSGTSARLILGMLSGYDVVAELDGDASLTKRPMQRVVHPLALMGAEFFKPQTSEHLSDKSELSNLQKIDAQNANIQATLPLVVKGSSALKGISYSSPQASAQVKTSILLAGLNAHGTVKVHEPHLSRNHTELMLPAFGARVDVLPDKSNAIKSDAIINGVGVNGVSSISDAGVKTKGSAVMLEGSQQLHACNMRVPADPSSAIFLVVAACLVRGSNITITNVGLNPTRAYAFEVAKQMGCNIEVVPTSTIGKEPVGNIVAAYEPNLHGVVVRSDKIATVIDEIPVLALLATACSGTTIFEDVAELRVKESNRLAAIVEGLTKLGCVAKEDGDNLVVSGGVPNKSAVLKTHKDHRLAMTWTLANRCFALGGEVDNTDCINVSFPHFFETLDALQRGDTSDNCN